MPPQSVSQYHTNYNAKPVNFTIREISSTFEWEVTVTAVSQENNGERNLINPGTLDSGVKGGDTLVTNMENLKMFSKSLC